MHSSSAAVTYFAFLFVLQVALYSAEIILSFVTLSFNFKDYSKDHNGL